MAASPDFLKRVEVLRDPAFSLYGLDSILPVVNLIDMALGSHEARRVGVEGSGELGGMGKPAGHFTSRCS